MKIDLSEQYLTGDPIHVGDRVLLGGQLAVIVAVIGRSEYAQGFSAADWTDYPSGFVMRTEDGELYMYERADEDVKLISRAVPK